MNNYPSYTGIIISQCKDPVMNQLGFHGMSGFCSRCSCEGRTTCTFLDDKEITDFVSWDNCRVFHWQHQVSIQSNQNWKAVFFLTELMWKKTYFLKDSQLPGDFWWLGGHLNQPLKRSRFHSPTIPKRSRLESPGCHDFFWKKIFRKSQPNHQQI